MAVSDHQFESYRVYSARLIQMSDKLGLTDSDQDYDVTEQIGRLLRRATQRHTTIFQRHIGNSQLTVIQFVTLCILCERGPSSQVELVNATVLDQATNAAL